MWISCRQISQSDSKLKIFWLVGFKTACMDSHCCSSCQNQCQSESNECMVWIFCLWIFNSILNDRDLDPDLYHDFGAYDVRENEKTSLNDSTLPTLLTCQPTIPYASMHIHTYVYNDILRSINKSHSTYIHSYVRQRKRGSYAKL